MLFLLFKGELQIFKILLKVEFRAVCIIPSHPFPVSLSYPCAGLLFISLVQLSRWFISGCWCLCRFQAHSFVPCLQLAEYPSPEGLLPRASHGASLSGTHVPRVAAAHPPCCPERSPQGKAPHQSSRSVLPKTFQIRGHHGGDRDGCGIHSPGHLTTAIPMPLVCAG